MVQEQITPSAKALAHTAAFPWKLSNPASDGYAFRILGANFPQDGEESIVADLLRLEDGSRKQFEANAAFIVRAANSHYQLLSALKDAKAKLETLREEAFPIGDEPDVTLRARLRNIRTDALHLAETLDREISQAEEGL